MNNALGVNLSGNLAVGRVDFATTNKGIIHTGANTFTINNTSGNARVVNGYGSNAYVEGTVARIVKSATAAIFPTGLSGTFRKFTLTPNNTATNTFTVSLVTGNNGGTPVSPVAGLSNYYWNVTRTGTSSAVISMDLAGAEPLRSATDTLIAAAYSGGNWLDARATGNYIFPGNSASGNSYNVPAIIFLRLCHRLYHQRCTADKTFIIHRKEIAEHCGTRMGDHGKQHCCEVRCG